MECTVARAFWEQTNTITGVKLPPLHLETWTQDLLEGRAGSKKNQTTIIIGMYALWMQRNRRRHGELGLPIRAAVQWAVDLAFDLMQTRSSQIHIGRTVEVPTWENQVWAGSNATLMERSMNDSGKAQQEPFCVTTRGAS
jgi:hypothetical protein